MTLPNGRNHRTALVIDVRNGDGGCGQFAERYARLLRSVGGEHPGAGNGIMVDVYTLRGNSLASGPGLVRGTPGESVAPDASGEIDLNAWAAAQGYDQLLLAINPNNQDDEQD